MANDEIQPRITGEGNTVTKANIYETLTSLINHAEQLRWNRVNTLLVVNSIFIGAWVGVFVATKAFIGKALLLAILCAPSVILGYLFAVLGQRSSGYMDELFEIASKMESEFSETLPKPLSAIKSRRQTLCTGIDKYSTSTWIVTAIPIFFGILFFLLAFVSLIFG